MAGGWRRIEGGKRCSFYLPWDPNKSKPRKHNSCWVGTAINCGAGHEPMIDVSTNSSRRQPILAPRPNIRRRSPIFSDYVEHQVYNWPSDTHEKAVDLMVQQMWQAGPFPRFETSCSEDIELHEALKVSTVRRVALPEGRNHPSYKVQRVRRESFSILHGDLMVTPVICRPSETNTPWDNSRQTIEGQVFHQPQSWFCCLCPFFSAVDRLLTSGIDVFRHIHGDYLKVACLRAIAMWRIHVSIPCSFTLPQRANVSCCCDGCALKTRTTTSITT